MRGRSRAARPIALAVVLVTATALTGCSSTISGHGSTAAAGAPASGTPSAGGFPGNFPSNGPSVANSGGGSAGPSGSGVSFNYPQGHFRATFPAQPTTDTTPGSVAGASYTLYLAQAEVNDQPTLLACEDISVSLPADQYDDTLRGAVGGFEGSSGLTLQDQQSTTFRGHAARQAHFSSPHGGTYTLLATMFTGNRLYLFFGPTGAVFNTLTSTFQPI